jgi:F-type H+-transporting ATPase subunit a
MLGGGGSATMPLAIECDVAESSVCAPETVNELFEFAPIFGQINRTIILMFLASLIVVAVLFVAYRAPKLVPTKFQAAVDAVVRFVRDEVAVGIIGPEGIKYAPYLLSLFLFILVSNIFEVTPFINFPITSRMAIPLFLALLTWVIFVVAGIRKQGLAYFGHIIWPPGVPVAIKPLLGIIEFVSIFLIRPFSLAVRLFANMVAGHVMLSILLVSGVLFIAAIPEVGAKGLFGIAWFALALAIFLFEILVSVLQAYIFTLLSAVYIQTSVHPEH